MRGITNWHRLHYILVLTVIVFAAVAAIFLTRAQRASAQAQNEVIAYLAEKFASREVPVASLQVHRNSLLDLISGSPLRVEVILQSASNGEKVAPEDLVNIQAVARAVSLARGEGYPVDVLTTVVQNTQGQAIFWAEEPVQDEILPEQIPTSQVNNRVTEDFVKEELELYGLILEDMVISPNQSGDQLLTIKLSALDIVTANQAIPAFMPSLQAMFQAEDNFNKRHNTQITTVIVALIEKDSGENLLNYSLDVVTGRETWTMADELTKDWFPHPPK